MYGAACPKARECADAVLLSSLKNEPERGVRPISRPQADGPTGRLPEHDPRGIGTPTEAAARG